MVGDMILIMRRQLMASYRVLMPEQAKDTPLGVA